MISFLNAVWGNFDNCDKLPKLVKKSIVYQEYTSDVAVMLIQKRTVTFQHILLRWITGEVLSFGYNGLEDLQLFGLLFVKCVDI